MTNIQKWNELGEQFQNKLTRCIEQHKIIIPQKVYEVTPMGIIRVREITGYTYKQIYYAGKRPSREKIEELRKLVDTIEFVCDQIMMRYTTVYIKHSVSGAFTFKDLHENKNLFVNKTDAEICAEVRQEKHEKEIKMLENGHFRCNYCMKVVPNEDEVLRTIINIKMYGRNGRQFSYCSGQCGVHDQMAHEG